MIPAQIYLRVIAPGDLSPSVWANRVGIPPFVIGHLDPEQVGNDALDNQWTIYIQQYGIAREGVDAGFLRHLETAGYVIYPCSMGGVWSPVNI